MTRIDGTLAAAFLATFSSHAWAQCTTTKLTPLDGTDGMYFGSAVAVDGDRVVVGAQGDDVDCPAEGICNSAGSAYIFARDDNGTPGDISDDAWVEERAPLWPLDFDERFFCAASDNLTTPNHLVGGEPVTLAGVSPDGRFDFPLPTARLLVKARFRSGEKRAMMTLDAVHLEPDEGVLTLTWRAAVPSQRELHEHEVTLVRQLEDWEEPKL